MRASYLCQTFKETQIVGRRSTTKRYAITMPDKLGAAAALSKMLGWDKPKDCSSDDGDTLTELLGLIRKNGSPTTT
jgi:hypothetical protein